MANSQFGFYMNSVSNAYGASVSFNVANGITSIAQTSSGCWCNAGNLLIFDSGSGEWVECAVTFVNQTSSQGCSGGINVPSPGWYLALTWSGNTTGSHIALGYNPTGDTVTLTLQWDGTQWNATYTDPFVSTLGPYSVGASQFTGSIVNSLIFFENGGNTTCSNYGSFGGITFSNVTYYNSSGTQIGTGGGNGNVLNSNPPQCSSTVSCLNTNTSNLTISRNC